MARPQRTVRTQPPQRRDPAERTWLDGPPPRVDGYPGDRLGLPPEGRGSIASPGAKLGAYLLDLVGSGLVALLIVRPHTLHDEHWSNLVGGGVFVVVTAVAQMLSGRTPGMLLTGIQVVRLDGRTMGWRSWPRQVACALLVPAVITDRDRRGLHDKLVGTAVVRVS